MLRVEAGERADIRPDVIVPASFLRLRERLQQRIERKLGYFGQARYVLFYDEPRGGEIMWNDGLSYGFGTGAWCTFSSQIAPLGRRYGIELEGQETASKHALLVDRASSEAYLADRRCAERWLVTQHEPNGGQADRSPREAHFCISTATADQR